MVLRGNSTYRGETSVTDVVGLPDTDAKVLCAGNGILTGSSRLAFAGYRTSVALAVIDASGGKTPAESHLHRELDAGIAAKHALEDCRYEWTRLGFAEGDLVLRVIEQNAERRRSWYLVGESEPRRKGLCLISSF